METVTRLLLIRHGINDYVESNRLAGWLPGVHLNQRGREQVAALGRRLADAPITAIYSSPLERTMETAEAVRGERSLVISALEEIGEGKCGDWTGLHIDEKLRSSALWREMEIHPSTARYPGGESLVEMQMRMVMAIETIRRNHVGETIAVVSHADPLRSAIAHYLGLHLDMFQRMQIQPASISEIEFNGARHQVVRVNDVAHYA